MQAIILAGGLGSRLGIFFKNTSKPFLKVNNNPFVLVDRPDLEVQ
jgi:dTDP-glucose pyrophosphorylase